MTNTPQLQHGSERTVQQRLWPTKPDADCAALCDCLCTRSLPWRPPPTPTRTVNTCFTIVEMLFDWAGHWVPLYYEAKILFVVFLTIPNFRVRLARKGGGGEGGGARARPFVTRALRAGAAWGPPPWRAVLGPWLWRRAGSHVPLVAPFPGHHPCVCCAWTRGCVGALCVRARGCVRACVCGMCRQGAKMAYKLLAPYLSLCEPHFDEMVVAAGNAAQRGAHHIRTASQQFIAGRVDVVASLVRWGAPHTCVCVGGGKGKGLSESPGRPGAGPAQQTRAPHPLSQRTRESTCAGPAGVCVYVCCFQVCTVCVCRCRCSFRAGVECVDVHFAAPRVWRALHDLRGFERTGGRGCSDAGSRDSDPRPAPCRGSQAGMTPGPAWPRRATKPHCA
jgi:hypothetical protein